MRRNLLLLIAVLLCQLGFAATVSQKEARQQALQFINQHPTAKRMLRSGHAAELKDVKIAYDKQQLYVFNIGRNEGFVVVSADDNAPTVLGYADDGLFDSNQIPENMQAWLQEYADQLNYLKEHPKTPVALLRTSEHQAIKPLLKSTWDQDAPYYNLCPLDNGERSLTGCVATAMAQVINYHKYPAKTTAVIPAYTTETKNLNVSAIGITTIDWDNILDSYTGNETAAQKQAVAKLMQLCGASVQMDYSAKGSAASSNNVPEVMKAYFDYDAATRMESRGNYRASEWDDLIYNELQNNRPVYYRGSSSGSGHAFVVDGYDRDGLFHVNWGWSGGSNGYFLLSILDSRNNSGNGASLSSDGYSMNQQAIIDAQPNTGIIPSPIVRLTISKISTEQTTITLEKNAFLVQAKAEGIRNYTGETHTFEVGTGVFKPNGELVYAEYNGTTAELPGEGWGYGYWNIGALVPALPDGNYHITAVSREMGTETWYMNDGGKKAFIPATISGNTMTLRTPTVSLHGEMAVTGNRQVGSVQNVTISVKNDGTFYNEQLYLRLDGEVVGGRYFEAEDGETVTLNMTFTPDTVGTKKLDFGYITSWYDSDKKEWIKEFHEVASTTVEIAAAKSYDFTFSNGDILNWADGRIHDIVANLQVDVTNNSSDDYNEELVTYYYKYNAANSKWSYKGGVKTPVEIGAGETKTVRFDVPLSEDGKYLFIVIYKTDGKFISVNDKKSYVFGNVQVVINQEILTSIQDAKQTVSPTGTIYNLNGQRVEQPRKGLYITDGKKVLK